jgi:hypothetical protein
MDTTRKPTAKFKLKFKESDLWNDMECDGSASYYVKVEFSLEQTMKTQKRSRGIALLFL